MLLKQASKESTFIQDLTKFNQCSMSKSKDQDKEDVLTRRAFCRWNSNCCTFSKTPTDADKLIAVRMYRSWIENQLKKCFQPNRKRSTANQRLLV